MYARLDIYVFIPENKAWWYDQSKKKDYRKYISKNFYHRKD